MSKKSANENDSVVLSFYSASDEMNASSTKLENNKVNDSKNSQALL
jgi:hypothetical protein